MRAAIVILVPALAALTACGPTYVDESKGETAPPWANEVAFEVHDAYAKDPPDCVMVMPLTAQVPSQPKASADDLAKVRLSLFAHLATQSKREVRLERIDRLLPGLPKDPALRRRQLGEKLKCAAALEGVVTEYGSQFFGLYSRVAVGAKLRLVRARDGVVLWEARHVAVSNVGSIPLDPVGVAVDVVDAAVNVRDEQVLRLTDDLARRVIGTIPDNHVAALDDPAGQPAAAKPASPLDAVAEGERLLAQGDHEGALAAAERAIAVDPDRADAYFLKGRVLMLDRSFDQAEKPILRAVALDRRNGTYLNALGAVSAARGAPDTALAAYRMAIEADPADGFAWYNTGVIHEEAGRLRDAADAFTGAGLAYAKAGDVIHAERALSDLRELSRSGLNLSTEIATIEDALAQLARSKT